MLLSVFDTSDAKNPDDGRVRFMVPSPTHLVLGAANEALTSVFSLKWKFRRSRLPGLSAYPSWCSWNHRCHYCHTIYMSGNLGDEEKKLEEQEAENPHAKTTSHALES